ncbi:hypothetical protein KSP40_PGU011412 [Platanthera guangdongensis]|uniref:Uncharacterized protein n=1 Tax=Platanthera guangdongensis TaxID=2320717 RepID=A0ABR2LNP5_9ASPA
MPRSTCTVPSIKQCLDYSGLKHILESLPVLLNPMEIKTKEASLAEEGKTDEIFATIDGRYDPNRVRLWLELKSTATSLAVCSLASSDLATLESLRYFFSDKLFSILLCWAKDSLYISLGFILHSTHPSPPSRLPQEPRRKLGASVVGAQIDCDLLAGGQIIAGGVLSQIL